ncbi:M48 family metallopeptidase [Entomomonas asaccharolytica]|uniref:M48 family metallopeptidase n=1 Tax=Entomomonas asaccharolytica TaxID=2785331 RepID=A0A974ND45_9GAMM|nr:M48 family metallopeptidase [Entomomonas asaccharolytica]QQP84496.1 M48 family metallopeptidase [Entomomonas asaccharolytica]
MNFFKLQNKAKSQTFWLVILFCLGLIILPFIGAHIITFCVEFFTLPKNRSPETFWLVLKCLTVIIILVSLYKYISLRQGGRVIAIALGGRLVDKRASNPNERRLLNVVEEMAIASSVPVPHVYILDEEIHINAFAAGHTINDAVIGVTRGTTELLTRDELQAVIAHEFSHILNGDMRLNLRFTALLFGFIFISQAGFVLLRLGFGIGNEKKGGIFPHFLVLAVALLAAGFLGQLWARIMQAAVNRQREYLADASSVQFTRHGPALASALKKIGGSEGGATLETAMAGSYGHFFFSQADTNLLATHPPLEKRIKRIEPWWQGGFINVDFSKLINSEEDTEPQQNNSIRDKKLTAAIAAGLSITGTDAIPYLKPVTLLNTNVTDKEQAIAKLEAICHEPMDACYLMFALLVDTIPSIRAKQFLAVNNTGLVTDYYQTLSLIPKEKHLEFIEKAIPSLKNLSDEQYKNFKTTLMHFIQADNEISLYEWLIYQLIIHQVDGQFNPKAIITSYNYNSLDQLRDEAAIMLSGIAHLTENPDYQQRAFGLGSNIMGLYTIKLLQQKPNISQLTTSLQKLQKATEPVRRKFLQGALRAIEHDQQVNIKETMFFRILSLCLDCPIPTLDCTVH